MPLAPAPRRADRSARPGVERLDARLTPSVAGPAGLATVIPSDRDFSRQWGLNDPSNIDVDAPEAWRVTTGSASTIVAVLDSGIDAANPEFRNRLWVNPASPGRGAPSAGWNFVANNDDVRDDYGHGTHVAGILGAARDGKGIVGVDWNARLMILKVLDSRGAGDPAAAAAAIRFAVDNGARVISISWATDQYSRELDDAIADAGARGAVVVAAAGNNAADLDQRPVYPASFDLPNILVVAAVDRAGNLASFSNRGAISVDLAAPGVDVYGPFASRSGHATLSGTSMAVPQVAGVVSLVVGQHPDWSAERIVEHVKATVKPLPGLAGLVATGGMVDAAKAVGAPTSPAPAGSIRSASTPPIPSRRPAPRGIPLRPTRPRAIPASPIAATVPVPARPARSFPPRFGRSTPRASAL